MATISKKAKKAAVKPPKSRPASTGALVQPVTTEGTSLTSLSAFSPDGQWFALLSLAVDKHKLRVFDTNTGKAIAEYILQASSVTSLQWAKIAATLDPPQSPQPKKRRRTIDGSKQQEATLGTLVVILGLANGGLTCFSPTQGTSILSLSSPASSSAILAAILDPDQKKLWTSSSDCSIRLWDVHKNSVIQSWKSKHRSPYSTLSLKPKTSADADTPQQVLAANHAIDLLELPIDPLAESSKPRILATFSGHTSALTSIHWISSHPGPRFVTSAERDRFLQGWSVPSSGVEGKIAFSAPVDGDIRKVHVSSDENLIIVVSSTGAMCLFACPPSSSSTTTLDPQSVISISPPKGKGAAEPTVVLDAIFAPNRTGALQVARLSNGVRPVFQEIRFTDDDGAIISEISAKSTGATSLLGGDEEPINQRYHEKDQLARGSGLTMPQDVTMDDAEAQLPEGTLDTEMAELTLGERLRAMNGGVDDHSQSGSSESEHGDTKKGKKTFNNQIIDVPTESLSRTLIQALHSSDAKLLEGCLRHSDAALIRNTVRRIPPQLAVSLLQACVDRLGRGRGGNTAKQRGSAASAQRGTAMVAWIKAVLIIHSGHLMTMPNLVTKLSSLHATLTTRLALHERLLSLNGRLDLALSQIELRSAKTPAHLSATQGKPGKGKDKNVTRYIEGDSSDDEDMEPEIERGSEDGSIEDIGLGGGDDESLDEGQSGSQDSDEEEDEDEENGSDDEDEDEDEDEDSDMSEGGPRANGLIDDEAEESWGSEEDEDDDDE